MSARGAPIAPVAASAADEEEEPEILGTLFERRRRRGQAIARQVREHKRLVIVAEPGAGRANLLTARELQVLEAVRGARRNSEIGVALGISPLTVKNHLRKIMQKLGARNRAHAVAEAMSRRLIA